MKTGLFDKHGVEIEAGNFVSLAGNMTADNSMGVLPNGWNFDEEDVYEVYWDERMNRDVKWSLKTGVEPDSPYNCKYLNHALSLLYDGNVEIVSKPESV